MAWWKEPNVLKKTLFGKYQDPPPWCYESQMQGWTQLQATPYKKETTANYQTIADYSKLSGPLAMQIT